MFYPITPFFVAEKIWNILAIYHSDGFMLYTTYLIFSIKSIRCIKATIVTGFYSSKNKVFLEEHSGPSISLWFHDLFERGSVVTREDMSGAIARPSSDSCGSTGISVFIYSKTCFKRPPFGLECLVSMCRSPIMQYVWLHQYKRLFAPTSFTLNGLDYLSKKWLHKAGLVAPSHMTIRTLWIQTNHTEKTKIIQWITWQTTSKTHFNARKSQPVDHWMSS